MLLAFAGCHGAGKTTLCAALAERCVAHILPRTRSPQSDGPFDYLRCSLARHREEALSHLKIAAGLPTNTLLLKDRSIIDWFAYLDSFCTLSWITPEQHADLMNEHAQVFLDHWQPRHLIFVDPEPAWINERLAARRTEPTHRFRWRESSVGYVEATVAAYRRLLATTPSTTLLRLAETDPASRLKMVLAWPPITNFSTDH